MSNAMGKVGGGANRVRGSLVYKLGPLSMEWDENMAKIILQHRARV